MSINQIIFLSLTSALISTAFAVEPALISAPAAAESAATAEPTISQAVAEIESLSQQVVGRGKIPGLAVAIVHNGKVVSARGYGVTQAGTREAVTADTVFRIASLSKGFAATLSGLLVESGALSWDTPVRQQLPAFELGHAEASGQLTVRDVLSHRLGLKYNSLDRDLEANQPYPLLARRLADAPMLCAPGECYGYQNIAFSLIGDIAFAVTGDFYVELVEKRIFHPLGMDDSTFGREALISGANWARPHVRGRRGWLAVQPKESYYRVPPAAGINASINDMAKWMLAQLGHYPDLLSPALLKQIHEPVVDTPDQLSGSMWRRTRLHAAQYAMGWRVLDYSGHRAIYHAGAVQGYRAMMGFLPEKDIGIIALWNSESSAPSGLMPSLLDRALGLESPNWMPAYDPAPRAKGRR